MSFIRVGCRSQAQKKRKSRKKDWDYSVNDLDAYKATPEEIAYRKAAHRSKHAVTTHLVRPGSAKKGKKSSPFRHNSHARKIALMKEVLYDQRQLQEVLEKSDTMMAVVKDLFGDDPRRFEGFPSVTTAPNSKKADVASSLVNLPPEMRTKSEELSDTLMSSSALNDFHDSDSDLEESHDAPLSYQPKMNMQRFQQFLEAEERNNTLSTISGQAGMSHLGYLNPGAAVVHSSHLPDQTNNTNKDGTLRTPPKAARRDPNESLEMLRPPKSAMNDTGKIQKTRQRVPRPEPALNTSNLSLGELRKVLESLEDEIADYEQATGRRPPAERHRQESFSGYTLALVDSVTKLTRYLRECELHLKAEVMVREQLTQDVVEFRALVDALTSDIILTQEEFQKMLLEFQKFRIQTQEEIRLLKAGQPLRVENGDDHSLPGDNVQSLHGDHVQSLHGDHVQSLHGDHVQTQTPPKNTSILPHRLAMQSTDSLPVHMYPRASNPFGDHLQPVSAAVMLSPPVRRSRVMEPDRDLGPKQQQENLLEIEDLATEETFASLPASGPSSLGQVFSQYVAAPTQSAGARQPMNNHQAPAVTRKPAGSQPRAPAVAAVNSVSVPRPTPLVQSNVGIPLPSNEARSLSQQNAMSVHQQSLQHCSLNGHPISVVPLDKPQTLYRDLQDPLSSSDRSQQSVRSHDSQGSDRELLASQIAALNKQHEEAQRRLKTLMHQQQAAQGPSVTQQQEEQQRVQQQQQQQRQQVVDNQQRIQQQQLQFQQQQKLIEMVIQQQQKIQQQQLEKQQQQQELMMRQQQQQYAQVQTGLTRPDVPRDASVRQSADLPGYRPQKQTGLPSYPISPNISPISQRSESVRPMYQGSQNGMAASGRGITVSIPSVDMDQSHGSPSPNPPITAR